MFGAGDSLGAFGTAAEAVVRGDGDPAPDLRFQWIVVSPYPGSPKGRFGDISAAYLGS
jgi:hypothetical protein